MENRKLREELAKDFAELPRELILLKTKYIAQRVFMKRELRNWVIRALIAFAVLWFVWAKSILNLWIFLPLLLLLIITFSLSLRAILLPSRRLRSDFDKRLAEFRENRPEQSD
jgi:hypothetical protein